MGNNIFKTLTEHYPFLTLCVYAEVEYLGVVQNQDDIVTTIYDFTSINDSREKKLFLELAGTWWWESNRTIPINIFLKREWDPFRIYLKTFSNRDLAIVHGPVCSLNAITRRRSKKRSITLVQKLT
jgi:hypothetical protein